MYLIDTNIFLEVLLNREKRKECEKFLKKVEDGEIIGVVTTFSLHSIAIIIEKLKGLRYYKKFLEIIKTFRGLVIYSTTLLDEIEICKIAEKYSLTFDDALHYYVAKRFGLALVSLDQDFDKTDLKRKEPGEISP